MTELLNTGKRIRHFRILRGMTQKALGMAVGFPAESADIRIAQYESGTRTPKQNLLRQMAQALGVSPSVLAVPRIKDGQELSSLLIALKDECGIVLSPQSDNAAAIFESHGTTANISSTLRLLLAWISTQEQKSEAVTMNAERSFRYE